MSFVEFFSKPWGFPKEHPVTAFMVESIETIHAPTAPSKSSVVSGGVIHHLYDRPGRIPELVVLLYSHGTVPRLASHAPSVRFVALEWSEQGHLLDWLLHPP